jgi:hypothetical protein
MGRPTPTELWPFVRLPSGPGMGVFMPGNLDDRPLLTLPAAAVRLGLNVETLRKAIAAGDVPAVRIGSREYVPAGVLADLLAGRLPRTEAS